MTSRGLPDSSRGGKPAGLRIAIIGPTYPYKGGVAAHTTALAHELDQAGHDVVLLSWRHLYPSLLYPGEQRLPAGLPDTEPYPNTRRTLSWARPSSWWRAGAQVRHADLVVIVHIVPQVVPAHLILIKAARARRGLGPSVTALVHNVLPHEERVGTAILMKRFFAAADSVIVHSQEQSVVAATLGARDVHVVALPPHLPGGLPLPRHERRGPVRLLALGIVREYKGLDLVLRAMREVPGVHLTIAGEMWGRAGERIESLANDPALDGRVDIRPGYLPSDQVASVLSHHDVLVLAYRSGTGSQNVMLAHHHGLPVLATRVGTLGDQVRDGIDGLVISPMDHVALVNAIRTLADRAFLDSLRAGVRSPDLSAPWTTYVSTLESVAVSLRGRS